MNHAAMTTVADFFGDPEEFRLLVEQAYEKTCCANNRHFCQYLLRQYAEHGAKTRLIAGQVNILRKLAAR